MAVEDPGTLQVTCDECGDEKDMNTTAYVGNPATFGVSDETLQEEGWDEYEGEILCPECLNKRVIEDEESEEDE